jgi:flagellar biosynthesis/type III secretory pathway protein FliH
MNSSAKQGRLVRALGDDGEIFVLGGVRTAVPNPGGLASLSEMVAAAEAKAEEILANARAEAAAIVAEAEASAEETRSSAYADGLARARVEVNHLFEGELALVRQAAAEGKSLRDDIAGQAVAVIAAAAAVAARRIVGEAYAADPALTAAACAEALRAASGQEVLALRVNAGIAGEVQARLVDGAGYVRPDDSVEVGGCIVDLKHGTIDATLDARISLMELALAQAGGGLAQ